MVDQFNANPTAALVNLPEDLMTGRRFVCWQYQERDGKSTKVPLSPCGGYAKSNDPITWGTFMEAVNCCERNVLSGIGIMLSKDDDLVGIDLDHCIDNAGGLSAEAEEIVSGLNSYSEITPSGKGLRVFVKGKLPEGARRKGPIEMYDDLRYLTLTGNHLDGTPENVETRQTELVSIWRQYVAGPEKKQAPEKPITNENTISNDELIQRAMAAKNGSDFKRLWEGDFSAHPSQSEADLALCCHLAFWTGNDAGRIDNLFRQSELYREKWDRIHVQGRTYGEETIRKAIDGSHETFKPAACTATTPGELMTVAENSGTSIIYGGDLTKARPRHTLRFRSHADIVNDPIETEWIIEGLLPARSLTVFFARGGMGKSTLALQLHMMIQWGLPFLERKTIKTPSYYVDMENPLDFLKTRLSNYEEDPESWYTTSADEPAKIDSEDFVIFQQLKPGVIFFDTLKSMHNVEENSPSEMSPIMDKLRELRDRGFTVVVLHHTPKGSDNTFRGCTAIRDAADHMMALTKVGQLTEDFDPDAVYRWGVMEKSRFGKGEIYMKLDVEKLVFNLCDDPKKHLEQRILYYLETQGRQKKNTLVELTGYSESYVEKSVRKLKKEDRISIVKDGRFVFYELK